MKVSIQSVQQLDKILAQVPSLKLLQAKVEPIFRQNKDNLLVYKGDQSSLIRICGYGSWVNLFVSGLSAISAQISEIPAQTASSNPFLSWIDTELIGSITGMFGFLLVFMAHRFAHRNLHNLTINPVDRKISFSVYTMFGNEKKIAKNVEVVDVQLATEGVRNIRAAVENKKTLSTLPLRISGFKSPFIMSCPAQFGNEDVVLYVMKAPVDKLVDWSRK
jgi:hypothetical protein